MKPPRLLAFFFMAASAVAQVTVPAQEAARAPSYWPRAVQASAHSLKGKLIKLQFVCRSSVIGNAADGGVTGEVVDSPGTRIRVDVEVPKDAVDWFMRVPTTYVGGPPFTIYARLSTDKFGAPVAMLLGQKLRSDASGSQIEW
ncbi:MAG: hypothetical protein ABSE62_03990 [Chthoniobacteraceae bacterium]|jgi:hypothetical protein